MQNDMRQIIVAFVIAVLLDFQSIGTTIKEVRYSFSYAVEAGDVVTHHWEERRGDLLRGSYSLLEPNGKIRVVQYQADDTRGFRAVVKHRNQPGFYKFNGHLMPPNQNTRPIQFAKPIHLITSEHFQGPRTYPNLPNLNWN